MPAGRRRCARSLVEVARIPAPAAQPLAHQALARDGVRSIGDVVDADRDGQARELVFELRAGAAARAVQAKVVAFRVGADGCAAVRRTLFSYPRTDTIGRRPKGTFFSTGSIRARNFSKRFSGLELRTFESYGRATDPGCCPSYTRTTFWRSSRRARVTSRSRRSSSGCVSRRSGLRGESAGGEAHGCGARALCAGHVTVKRRS